MAHGKSLEARYMPRQVFARVFDAERSPEKKARKAQQVLDRRAARARRAARV